jgi:hypothetical protein
MTYVPNNENLSPYFINAQLDEDYDFCEVESCVTCDLVNEYIDLISEVESKLELEQYLFELVEDAQKIGIRQSLISDIHQKANMLDAMENECECDGCCDIE